MSPLDHAIEAAEEVIPSGWRVVSLVKEGSIWTAIIAHVLSGERFEGSAFSADAAVVAAHKKLDADRG